MAPCHGCLLIGLLYYPRTVVGKIIRSNDDNGDDDNNDDDFFDKCDSLWLTMTHMDNQFVICFKPI